MKAAARGMATPLRIGFRLKRKCLQKVHLHPFIAVNACSVRKSRSRPPSQTPSLPAPAKSRSNRVPVHRQPQRSPLVTKARTTRSRRARLEAHLFAALAARVALPPFLALSRRSSTAATIIGSPTVASTNTSPNLPPSDGGTNLPHEIASLYGLPESPPQ